MSDTKLVSGNTDDFKVNMCVRAEFINKVNNQEVCKRKIRTLLRFRLQPHNFHLPCYRP